MICKTDPASIHFAPAALTEKCWHCHMTQVPHHHLALPPFILKKH